VPRLLTGHVVIAFDRGWKGDLKPCEAREVIWSVLGGKTRSARVSSQSAGFPRTIGLAAADSETAIAELAERLIERRLHCTCLNS
jgi:hypothetical protein